MIAWLARLIQADQPQELEHNLRWLFGYVQPYRRELAGLMLMALIATAMALLQPWLTKHLIDDGLLAKNWPVLGWFALAMVTVGVMSTALAGWNRYRYTRLSGRILAALRGSLFGHLQSLSPIFFAEHRTGDLLSRLDGDVAQIQRFAIDSLFACLTAVLGLVGALTLMLMLSWQLSLLVLVLVPVEFLWLRSMRHKVEQQTRITRESSADVASFLVEKLPATRFVQACGRQRYEQDCLQRNSDHHLKQLLALQVTEFVTQAVPSTLTAVTRAGAFLIGGWWVIEGQWPLGSLIAFSTYLGMATGPVNSLLGLYVALQRMSVSLNRVAALRLYPVSVKAPDEPLALPEGALDIRLEQVSFGFMGRPLILESASVRIAAGSRVAISGISGAGKSTLIDLLHRHYDPLAGVIRLGGIDLRQLDPDVLRARVVVVSQDITLFRGSLADNLRYVAPDASDEQLMVVLRQASLQSLLDSLPDGLASPLGERGARLSGGQRQRLAIARALLQQPDILILDEATSAIDEATERVVIESVDRLFADRTRILISHRPSALEGCHQVLELADAQLRVRQTDPVLVVAEIPNG